MAQWDRTSGVDAAACYAADGKDCVTCECVAAVQLVIDDEEDDASRRRARDGQPEHGERRPRGVEVLQCVADGETYVTAARHEELVIR